MKFKRQVPWPTRCRCGAPLSFSCEDIESGAPADGADFWCSVGDPEKAPHNWGVIRYQPVLYGVES